MKKMMRTMAFMLAFITLVSLVLSSCTLWEKPEEHDLVAEWKKRFMREDGTIMFNVFGYIPNVSYNLCSNFSFRVENGQIVIRYPNRKYLYDSVIYVEDVEFEYNEGLLSYANRPTQLDKKETLEKLQEQKGCYIIETNDTNTIGSTMLVYELDGAYYFLQLEDNMVYTVSFAEFKENDNKCPFLSLFE